MTVVAVAMVACGGRMDDSVTKSWADGRLPDAAEAPLPSPDAWRLDATALDGVARPAPPGSAVDASTEVGPRERVAAPVFSPRPGIYKYRPPVELSTATPGATIAYTLDGTDPVPKQAAEYQGPITDYELSWVPMRAVAYKEGMDNSPVVAAWYSTPGGPCDPPAFDRPGGTYVVDCRRGPNYLPVSLTSATAGAEIYFTLDGSTPTATSMRYVDPIHVGCATTIKAIATASYCNDSFVSTAIYWVEGLPCLSMVPTISPNGGTFGGPFVEVTLTSTPRAIFLYTLNDLPPSEYGGNNTFAYLAPIRIEKSTVLRVIAKEPGWTWSNEAKATFILETP